MVPQAWDWRGTLPIFLSDVKARHDAVVELVERMMTADGLRLTAYGSDGMMSVSLKVPLTADGL